MAQHAVPTRDESNILTALFHSREGAERAYRSLRDRGYTDKDINVLMSDATRDKHYMNGVETEIGNKAMEGAGAGGALGGLLGAVIGGIAAIGTNVLLPGLGIVVAGPIAAALIGAGAGGATGGLVGALIGWGIPEERAKYYEEGIRDGGTVVGVKPRTVDDADYFENEWRTYEGQHIYR